MNEFFRFSIALLLIFCVTAYQPQITKKEALQAKVKTQIDSIEGDVAVAFLNLSDPSDTLYINEEEKYDFFKTT